MEIIENQDALQNILRDRRIVVVQFGSGRCAPCKALQNKISLWNREHPAVTHVYVSVDDLRELSAQMGVFTVPAILVYADGRLTIRQSGYFSLEQILDQTEKYERMLTDGTGCSDPA